MGLIDAYVKSMWKHNRVHAMYPPITGVKVGDVFSFTNGTYVHEFRLPVSPAGQSRHATGDWNSKAADGSSLDLVVNGKLPDGSPARTIGSAEVGAVAGLKSESSFIVNLTNVNEQRLDDVATLKHEVAQRFRHNDWDSEWIVVTEAWTAEQSTILAGSTSTTNVELKADATVTAATADLAKLAANFKVNSSGAASMIVDGAPSLVPVFRGYKFRLRDILKGTDEVSVEDLTDEEWDPTIDDA